MKSKTKKQQLTPWQTLEDATFTQKIQVGQLNQKIKFELIKKLKEQKNQQVKQQKQQNGKRIKSSSVRIKTEKVLQSKQILIPPIKGPNNISQKKLKPLNKNLITIINTYKQIQSNFNSRINVKNHEHVSKVLSSRKQVKNFHKSNKSVLIKNQIDGQRKSIQMRNFHLKDIRKNLFSKRSSSIQTLLKVKKQLQKLQSGKQKPILRKYSVRNMRLNTQNQILKQQLIKSSKSIETKVKTNYDKNSLNITQRFNVTKNYMYQQPNHKQRKSMQKFHILDKLYDRFN